MENIRDKDYMNQASFCKKKLWTFAKHIVVTVNCPVSNLSQFPITS